MEYGQSAEDRSQQISKIMCKPGHSWNEALKKCLPTTANDVMPEDPAVSAMRAADSSKNEPNMPNMADVAVQQEKIKRKNLQFKEF